MLEIQQNQNKANTLQAQFKINRKLISVKESFNNNKINLFFDKIVKNTNKDKLIKNQRVTQICSNHNKIIKQLDDTIIQPFLEPLTNFNSFRNNIVQIQQKAQLQIHQLVNDCQEITKIKSALFRPIKLKTQLIKYSQIFGQQKCALFRQSLNTQKIYNNLMFLHFSQFPFVSYQKKKLNPQILVLDQNIKKNNDHLKKSSSFGSKSTIQQNIQKQSQFPKSKLDPQITDFTFIKLIGQGSFAKVHLVCHKKTGMLFALKSIAKRLILKESNLINIIRQIKIQKYCNHPNLVKLYKTFHDKTKVYMLMEYCADGSLYDLSLDNQIIYQKQSKQVIKQIANGLTYMHQHNILHRDIKTQNVLINFGRPKICDFGCSIKYLDQVIGTIGSQFYLSPQQKTGKRYNHKADIWAFGILVYEMLIRQNPYQNQTLSNNTISYPVNIDIKLKSFLQNILKINPQQRADWSKIMSHPYLKKQG